MSPTETLKFYMLCDYILKLPAHKNTDVTRSIIERRNSSVKLQIKSPPDKDKVESTLYFNNNNEHPMYLSLNAQDIMLLKLKLYESLRKVFIGLSDDEFFRIISEK